MNDVNAEQSSEDSQGWLVIDTMTPKRRLLFDQNKPRQSSSIGRRKQGSSDDNRRLLAGVEQVLTEHQQIELDLGDGRTALLVPVLGPVADQQVYAIAAWIGKTSGAAPEPRVIGTMMWEPSTQKTYHSLTTERDILANEEVRDERVSVEVFRHFENYPNERKLGPWVERIMRGVWDPDADPFQDEIELRQTTGEIIRVHLTMRGAEKPDGERVIRGVIHDISDAKPPTGELGVDRRTTRAVAQLHADSGSGIGQLNYSTGVITEWFTSPPPPLHRWTRENAVYTDATAAAIRGLIAAVATDDDTTQEASMVTWMHFASDPSQEIEVRLTLRTANVGGAGNGILRVSALRTRTARRAAG